MTAVVVRGAGSNSPTVLGIDLGNHKCVAATAERNGVDVLLSSIGSRQIPSAVFFKERNRLIGEHTEGVGSSNPAQLLNRFKQLLFHDDTLQEDGDGSSSNSVSTHDSKLPFLTCYDPITGNRNAIVAQNNKMLPLCVRSLIAMLLHHIAALTDDCHPGTICVGVPSYFSARQRKNVAESALCAGLPHPCLMDEGTAVALAYGLLKKGSLPLENEGPQVVVFVDIGHLSTQVTVASFVQNRLKVLGRGWKKGCGVGAVEGRLSEFIRKKVQKNGIQFVPHRGDRIEFRLRNTVAALVRKLSANTEEYISIECIDGKHDINELVTREDLESLCLDLSDGVEEACKTAVVNAGILNFQKSVTVELLGGGSFIPLFRRVVENTFGKKIVCRTMNAFESVAIGLAFGAARHSTTCRLKPFEIIDRTQRDIEFSWALNGTVTNSTMLPSGSKVPVADSFIIDFGAEKYDNIDINISESGVVVSKFKGSINIEPNIPESGKIRRHSAIIPYRITESADFEMTLDTGRLETEYEIAETAPFLGNISIALSAEDEPYPKSVSRIVTRFAHVPIFFSRTLGGIRTHDIRKLHALELDFLKADKEVEKVEELRNNFEGIIYNMNERLSQNGDLYPIADVEQANILKQKLQVAEEWLSKSENSAVDDFKTQIDILNKLVEPLETIRVTKPETMVDKNPSIENSTTNVPCT